MLAERAREFAGVADRRAHARRPRRADVVRAQARGLRLRGPPQRRAARARLRPGGGRRDLGRRRDLRDARAGLRGARARAPRAAAPRTSPPRSSRATATPRCCQAIALAGAGLERLATELRHLQRTEVREVEEPFRAGQKGSSAMPHKRNPINTERLTGLARVLRGYAQTRPRGRRPLARARHLALRRRAGRPARRHDPARLHAAPRAARRARDDRPRRPHAGEPRADLRRAVLPARAARAGRVRPAARRRLPAGAAPGPAGVGHPDAAAHAARGRAGASRSTSTRSSTTATTCATSRPSSPDWRRSPAHDRAAAPPRRHRALAGPLPRDPARDHRPVPARRARRPHASR